MPNAAQPKTEKTKTCDHQGDHMCGEMVTPGTSLCDSCAAGGCPKSTFVPKASS